MPRQMHTLMRQILAAGQARQNAPAYVDDPLLSAEGNRAARDRHNKRVAEEFGAAAQGTLEAAVELSKSIFEASAAHRPRFNPDDTAALTRTAQAWQFGVLPRLDRGENITDVLRTVGVDAVLGAERFAPDYIAGRVENAAEVVSRAATARFIELAESPEAAAAIDEAAHFYGDLDTLSDVVHAVDRGEGLSAAMLVAQSAGASSADQGDQGPAAAGDAAA